MFNKEAFIQFLEKHGHRYRILGDSIYVDIQHPSNKAIHGPVKVDLNTGQSYDPMGQPMFLFKLIDDIFEIEPLQHLAKYFNFVSNRDVSTVETSEPEPEPIPIRIDGIPPNVIEEILKQLPKPNPKPNPKSSSSNSTNNPVTKVIESNNTINRKPGEVYVPKLERILMFRYPVGQVNTITIDDPSAAKQLAELLKQYQPKLQLGQLGYYKDILSNRPLRGVLNDSTWTTYSWDPDLNQYQMTYRKYKPAVSSIILGEHTPKNVKNIILKHNHRGVGNGTQGPNDKIPYFDILREDLYDYDINPDLQPERSYRNVKNPKFNMPISADFYDTYPDAHQGPLRNVQTYTKKQTPIEEQEEPTTMQKVKDKVNDATKKVLGWFGFLQGGKISYLNIF